MPINLHTKPVLKQTSDFEIAYLDLDIVAFAVASAADGHVYRVVDPSDHMLLIEAKYKKDINKWFKENPTVPKEWLTDDYEPDDIAQVIHSIKQMMTSILTDIGCGDYKGFLTGKDNFRYLVNPNYKANRIGSRRPHHLNAARQYLIDSWGAVVIDGMEADDALGLHQMADSKVSIIGSIDKDLHCIPGWHYSWSHHGKPPELKFVTKVEADMNFYRQVLTGDTTDNIIGLFRMGPATAKKLIDGSVTTERGMYEVVRDTYRTWRRNQVRVGMKSMNIRSDKQLVKVAKQIWILREDKLWEIPPTE